ncbi:MAG: zinc-dependent metalloprotease [Actinomycetota bacterium]
MSTLVDERVAAKVAARMASEGSLGHSYLLDELDSSFKRLTAEAEPLIAAETGFSAGVPAVSRVLSRKEWATVNVASMLKLMSPLLDKMERKIEIRSASPLSRMTYGPMLGAQMGMVLGFLSQKVLGQYDVVDGHQNEVWFVGPNIVLTERRFGFVPRDFRLWVAVHELTHRAQFEGNTWVREHFLSSVGNLIEALDIDASQVLRRMRNRSSRGSFGDAPIPLRLLGPDQIEGFNNLQAFMSVIEGHANFVMDRVAEKAIPTQPRMRETLKKGAMGGGWITKILNKVLGLDLKRAQYKQGQEFFDQVFAATGQAGVTACFASAENLPSLEEVKDPPKWLARIQP